MEFYSKCVGQWIIRWIQWHLRKIDYSKRILHLVHSHLFDVSVDQELSFDQMIILGNDHNVLMVALSLWDWETTKGDRGTTGTSNTDYFTQITDYLITAPRQLKFPQYIREM